ncbi:MAG TPA: hypothetical protein ENK02_01530, partial [Planctomycetes bacterium]|nr:hypothetical protein [Planctomycetota bacterium]
MIRAWPLLLLALPSCSSVSSESFGTFPVPEGVWSDLPDLPPTRARVMRASELLDRGKREEGRRMLLEVLERHPLYVPAHRLLQNLELAEGRAGRSWMRLERLEERFGEHPSLSYLKLRLAPPKYQGSERFAKALARFPRSFWLRYGLAWSLFQEKRRRRAADQLKPLMKPGGSFEPEVYLLAYRIGVRTHLRSRIEELRKKHPKDGILALLSFLLGSRRSTDLLCALEFASAYKETAQALMNALLSPRLRMDLLLFLEADSTRLERLQKSPVAPVIPLLLKMEGRPAMAARFMQGMFEKQRNLSNPISEDGILWNHLHQRMRELFYAGKVEEALALYREQFVPLMQLFFPREKAKDSAFFGALPALLEGSGRSRSAQGRLDLIRTLLQVGWVGEAEALGRFLEEKASLSAAQEKELRALLEDARGFLRFRSGVVELFTRPGRPQDLAKARVGLRELSRKILGVDVVGEPRVYDFGMLGTLWSPFGPGITEYFWQHGWYLLLGRPIGTQGISVLLARRLGVRRVHPKTFLPFEDGVREILLEDKFFSNRMDELLGTLGIALWDHYILDMDRMIHFLPVFQEGDPSILSDPFPRVAPLDMSRPCQVSRKLALRVRKRHPRDLFQALLDSIRTHEQAHLVDSHRMIPLYANPLRALRLFLDAGLSGEWVRANLEARAEVMDLSRGPDPLLSLAWMCTF